MADTLGANSNNNNNNNNSNNNSNPSAGTANNRTPIPAYRTFATHRSLFQNPFKDKIDLSNIPNDLKAMIMDQSTARLSSYEPAKYVTRYPHTSSI